MKKHFYSHLIQVDSIYIQLDLMDLTRAERQELMMLIESNIHHAVMDTVLSYLKEDDKKTFLSHVTQKKHEQLWEFLSKKIIRAEKKIQSVVDKLKRQMHLDIQKAKKKM